MQDKNAPNKSDTQVLPRQDEDVPVTAARKIGPGIYDVVRATDVTGISGTGRVAQLCVFEDGSAVTRWLTATRSTVVWERVQDAYHVHVGAHPDATRLVPVTEYKGTSPA